MAIGNSGSGVVGLFVLCPELLIQGRHRGSGRGLLFGEYQIRNGCPGRMRVSCIQRTPSRSGPENPGTPLPQASVATATRCMRPSTVRPRRRCHGCILRRRGSAQPILQYTTPCRMGCLLGLQSHSIGLGQRSRNESVAVETNPVGSSQALKVRERGNLSYIGDGVYG
jgi:hypothetical protein